METYHIRRARGSYVPGEAAFWQQAEVAELDHYPWFQGGEQWRAKAQLLYDNVAIYARMVTTDDRHIVAVHTTLNAPVCRDSCAEFFLQPNAEPGGGYFNFEVNCIGNMLLSYGAGRHGRVPVATELAEQVRRYASLGSAPIAEGEADGNWSVEAVIPLAVMRAYAPVMEPEPGAVWRGNFYRCADDSSNPQWNMWNRIELPKPDYHQPGYFGRLLFE